MEAQMPQPIMWNRYGKWLWLLFSRAVVAVIMGLLLTQRILPLPCTDIGGGATGCGDNYFTNLNLWLVMGISYAALLLTKVCWPREKFYLTIIVGLLLAWALTQVPT